MTRSWRKGAEKRGIAFLNLQRGSRSIWGLMEKKGGIFLLGVTSLTKKTPSRGGGVANFLIGEGTSGNKNFEERAFLPRATGPGKRRKRI